MHKIGNYLQNGLKNVSNICDIVRFDQESKNVIQDNGGWDHIYKMGTTKENQTLMNSLSYRAVCMALTKVS